MGNRASSDMLFGHCGDPLRFCDTADRFPVGEDFVVADIVVSQKAGDGQKTSKMARTIQTLMRRISV